MRIPVNNEIYLSKLSMDDVEYLVRHLEDETISQTTFIPFPFAYKDGVDFLRKKIEEYKKTPKPENFAIRNTKGEIIGVIGLLNTKMRHKPHLAEIGYWIAKEYRGKDNMTQCVKAMVGYVFSELPYLKIFAPIFKHNLASQRVVEKAGFHKEGEFRKHLFKNGEYLDAVQYAIIKGENE